MEFIDVIIGLCIILLFIIVIIFCSIGGDNDE